MHHLPVGVALAISLAVGLVLAAIASKDPPEICCLRGSFVLGDEVHMKAVTRLDRISN
ncbi:hypothetical protein NKI39_05495 [Mesorhizobium sp. M0664]|uniref:hypothetical protein n=1 Tax=Mesorhizobium sp. M0664 TaxID=2956982 RepID=UPI00333C8F4C